MHVNDIDSTVEREVGVRPASSSVSLNLCIREDVLRRIVEEIADNPDIEVGGKFVGYVDGPLRRRDQGWQATLGTTTIHIEAYIDAGPNADRSAVRHLSDLDYQEAIFDRLSKRFPRIQFLGLWHSHHPNGLDVLSGGDVNTGLSIVNSQHHNLDFLISSLATDRRGLHPSSHNAFVRGMDGYRGVDRQRVRTVSGRSEVAEVLDAWRTPQPAASRPDDSPTWFSTRQGRAVIAADRDWLQAYPNMKPVLNGGHLLWRGIVRHQGIDLECAYVYASDGSDGSATAAVTTTDGSLIRSSAHLDATSRDVELRLLMDNVCALATRFAGERAIEEPTAG